MGRAPEEECSEPSSRLHQEKMSHTSSREEGDLSTVMLSIMFCQRWRVPSAGPQCRPLSSEDWRNSHNRSSYRMRLRGLAVKTLAFLNTASF